VRHDIIITVLM